MLSSNKEDYLKIIYEEGGLETAVANKVIAEKLGVAPPSVSEMIVKLSKEGLIINEPYKGSRLTDDGFAMCLDLIRSHRLWEVFLIRHLGYSWRQAHEEAHHLEHVSDAFMVDKLDAYLGYPKTCPHGFIIPEKGHSIEELRASVSFDQLSDQKKGDVVILERVVEDGQLLDYLEANGLMIGSEIEIVDIAPYEGPITFIQNNETIEISYKAAEQVYVREI